MINEFAYKSLIGELNSKNVQLVAVSKTKSVEEIKQLFDLGQRDFGENYVQELVEKQKQLPQDIRWHFIGHLQRNKVKQIAPFIHLIQSVDSFRLLDEINSQASKANRTIDCLLEVHIADEESKFGIKENEIEMFVGTIDKHKQLNKLKDVNIRGLMGMASFTDDVEKIKSEFGKLKGTFERLNHPTNWQQTQLKTINLQVLSMGMTADYKIAIEEGSNMVRIGSLIFGERSQ